MNLRRSEKSRVLMMALSVALCICAPSAPLLGQVSDDFLSLQKHIDKQVTVQTQDGQVTGRLLRVEEHRLVVYEAATPKTITRESVKTVTWHKSRHTAAWVGGMAAAGFGTGFLLGFGAFNESKNANGKVGAAAGAGAGAGAAAGYALSRIGKRDQVVYQKQ
jgi:hypothetical protein